MNVKTKTTAAAALAAISFPGAALATTPEDPGAKGRANAEAKQERNDARQAEKRSKKAKKAKAVGFTLKGVKVSELAVTGGKLTSALTLDPTSANKHALSFLKITRAQLAGDDTVSLGEVGDAVIVKLDGIEAGQALLPTDVVKVQGKTTRVRKGDTTTTRVLDIRRITISRETETEQPEAEKPATQG